MLQAFRIVGLLGVGSGIGYMWAVPADYHILFAAIASVGMFLYILYANFGRY